MERYRGEKLTDNPLLARTLVGEEKYPGGKVMYSLVLASLSPGVSTLTSPAVACLLVNGIAAYLFLTRKSSCSLKNLLRIFLGGERCC